MYQSADVAARIKLSAKQKGITVKQVLANAGLGFNTMANMKISMPKADNLAKIADQLGCSVDYLLGRSPTPEWAARDLSPALQQLLQAAEELTDEELAKGAEYLNFLRASRK